MCSVQVVQKGNELIISGIAHGHISVCTTVAVEINKMVAILYKVDRVPVILAIC